MTNELPPLLRDAAERQAGVVTCRQAAEAGLEWSAVSWRLRSGRWQRLHQGVYATFSGELGRPAQLWAALLYAGAGAMLSHQTAAELAQLTDRPSELVHLTVPADRRVSPVSGIVIHGSARASEALHPARLPPQTRLEDTVLDLVDRARSLDAAIGWVTCAFGRKLTTASRLRAALEQRARMRWRRELTELLSPELTGLMSVLERRYLRDVERRHQLPTGARQVRVSRGHRTEYRDVLYEAYATCVELDGRLAHPAETRWRDIRRDNAVTADGGATLRYGWIDVNGRACDTAAELDRTLRSRGFAGARPCGPTCPVGRVAAAPSPEHSVAAVGPAPGTTPASGTTSASGAARTPGQRNRSSASRGVSARPSQ